MKRFSIPPREERERHSHTMSAYNEFLSTVRLKRAAFLLRSDLTLSISEISDKTGFSSPRYFGRCFKEAYGVSPLGYRNKGKEDEEQVEKDEE